MKLFSCLFVTSNAVPTVIWHGMGDYGNSSGMNRMKNLVLDNTDNDYVLSLQIGDSMWQGIFKIFRSFTWLFSGRGRSIQWILDASI